MSTDLVRPFRRLAATLILVGLVAASCGEAQPLPPRAEDFLPTPNPTRQPVEPDLEFEGPVPLALRASVPEGIDDNLLRGLRVLDSVRAVARVSIGQIVAESDKVFSSIAIAGVEPRDFRPLSAPSTAVADFVWDGLRRDEVFLAHEEFRRLGADPGSVLFVRASAGPQALRVGGVSQNSVPNIAGAIVALDKGRRLGLGEPTMLLIGGQEGTKPVDLRDELSGLFPRIEFEIANLEVAGSFFTGPEAEAAFGRFSFLTNPDGTINADPDWVSANIKDARVPILGVVRCHQLMFGQLGAALLEVSKKGLSDKIREGEYGGCYVPRYIGRDPANPLSLHAWGIAIDINVASNPVGAVPKMDRDVVRIFEKYGFRWGGRWSPPDGHHFELAGLLRS